MPRSLTSLIAALVAVLALLANPVAASAHACAGDHGRPGAMAGMAMAGMAMPSDAKAHDCCAHGRLQSKAGKDCAMTCALGCAGMAALAPVPVPSPFSAAPAATRPAPDTWAYAHDPPGLRRPPKAVA
jgi:hypothetical protein